MGKKLGVGIIGANLQGSWGAHAHLPALAALDGFQTVGVAASRLESATATAEKFGIPHAFADARALAGHKDVDIVAICVRVPAHHELAMIAIDAGKHVYCEWPLGRDTAEAEALQKAAAARGVLAMVGLQARNAPVLNYLRDLLDEGAIGNPRSASIVHSLDWISKPTPGFTYLNDRASGGHFLSIPGGHSIDALCWLLGEFASLSAIVKTTLTDIPVIGTDEISHRTSADQILVAGELTNGIVASARLSGAPSGGTGIRLEINGDKGDLVVTAAPGSRGIQMSDLTLQKTVGMAKFEELPVPERYFSVPESIRKGPPLNVGEAYQQLRAAIQTGGSITPDFGDAVLRHRTLDAIEEASKSKKVVLF
jgi:predicted dehydrogenase